MNRKLVITVLAIVSFAFLADAKTGPNPKHKRRNPVEFGGYVQKPNNGKVIQISDCQKRLAQQSLDAMVKSLSLNLCYPVVIIQTANATDNKLGEKSAIRVTLIEDPTAPRLVLAPEDLWARINVSALLADRPSPELETKRLTQETWRAVALLLGASDSSLPGCIMQPVYSLSDLDKIAATVPSPEPYNKMLNNARKLGLQYTPRVPYQVACTQGWAPAPTNDVQKAIWDKVHAMPTEPIKIKPETKKMDK